MKNSGKIPAKNIQKLGAFILSAAVKQIYPEVLLISAYADNESFYYEFGVQNPLKPKDIKKIEQFLHEFIAKSPKIHQFSLRIEDAYWLFKSEPKKIEDLGKYYSSPPIICKIADYYDLCGEQLPELPISSLRIEKLHALIPSQPSNSLPWIKQRIYGSVQV